MYLLSYAINNFFTERRLPRTKTTPSLDSPGIRPAPVKGFSLDISDDSISMLQRELEVEERIVEAARRMAELPTSNRKERQKRKQSLQQSVELCVTYLT